MDERKKYREYFGKNPRDKNIPRKIRILSVFQTTLSDFSTDNIWIWDRRFFKCNCNGIKLKETGKLSDPDAGHYVKKTGKYSVLTGTGYTE